MKIITVLTDYVHPPIPIRNFDWAAVVAGYEPGDFIGRGSTEQEAIDDLMAQIADLDEGATP